MLDCSIDNLAPCDAIARVYILRASSEDLPVWSAEYSGSANGEVQPSYHGGSWTCRVEATDPWEVYGTTIEGSTEQSCSGSGYANTNLVSKVQQYRGLGYWATKSSFSYGWTSRAYIGDDPYWRCASGTGNQLYRITATGYAESGSYGASVQSANYLRTTCP